MNRRKFLISACVAVVAPTLPIQLRPLLADATMDEIYNDISSMFNSLIHQENMGEVRKGTWLDETAMFPTVVIS